MAPFNYEDKKICKVCARDTMQDGIDGEKMIWSKFIYGKNRRFSEGWICEECVHDNNEVKEFELVQSDKLTRAAKCGAYVESCKDCTHCAGFRLSKEALFLSKQLDQLKIARL